MNRAATIKEVAEEAGVSVATVSRALQKPDVVAKDTHERVRAAVTKLGYAPNAQARNLRTSRTRIIIALMPDIANPFFSEVIRGIERVADAHGYAVLLGDTQQDERQENAYAQLIDSRQADGIITLLPHTPAIRRSGRLPIVNACEYVSDKAITSVYVDNVSSGRVATEYLLSLGHRRIAFVNGRANPISADREQGYREALEAGGVPVDRKLMVAGDFTAESGIRAVETLFALDADFTAVFCTGDELALGVMSGLRSRGKRIPDDVSIVGFDDIQMARFFHPPLTTIAQPKTELGEEAMKLLLELLDDPETPTRKRMLPTQLIVRSSTRAVSLG